MRFIRVRVKTDKNTYWNINIDMPEKTENIINLHIDYLYDIAGFYLYTNQISYRWFRIIQDESGSNVRTK